MSLAETQAIFAELQRIDAILSKIEGSSAALEHRLPEVTAIVITTQQALRVLWRFTALLRKMGLSEKAEEVINAFNRIARSAMYAYYALNLLSTGTVYGVAAGTIGLIGIALTSSDLLAGY